MGQLIEGKWSTQWYDTKSTGGRFKRSTSAFRNWITPDGTAGKTGTGGFKAEAGRYRLYVALICPWASRTLIARKLKGLESAITVSVVEPELTDQGWCFAPGADGVNGATYMHQIYTRADPQVNGRATVPVLWDMARNVMVSNESADILRMLRGAPPTAEEARALDAYLVTVSDHGLNASTFAARVIASTRAGLTSAVLGGR